MTILIISPEYFTYTNWGGIATFNKALAELLILNGNKVIILAQGYRTHSIEYNPNLTVHYFSPPKKIKFLSRLFPNTIELISWNLLFYRESLKLIQKHQIHVIHAPLFNTPTFLLKLIYKKAYYILHAHGESFLLDRFNTTTADAIIKKFLENIQILLLSDKIVACSEYIRGQLIKSFPNTKSKIIHIKNILPLNVKQSKLINKNKEKFLLYFGRFEYRKGVDLLVEAFGEIAEKNPELKLVLIGEDAQDFKSKKGFVYFKQWLKNLKLKNKIYNRILILPRIDNQEKLFKKILSFNPIVVLPSRLEPFGYTILEALSLGLIVIAGKKGGTKEIIQDEINGFLVSANKHDLVKTIHFVHNLSYSKKNSIKKAALVVPNNYTQEQIKEQYKELYDDIVSQGF